MAYSQTDRPIRITTHPDLLLESFTGAEGVSSPFEFRLRFLSEDPQLDLAGMLQGPVAVAMRLADSSEKFFHGKFNHLVQKDCGEDRLTAYEGTMVPSLWFLTLSSSCRIFQKKTVRQIVDAVLAGKVTDKRWNLTGSYEPREYCVQYRETDFNFVSRLMEEEGIFYFFKHEQGRHTLVMADNQSAFEASPAKAVSFHPAIPGAQPEDVIQTLDREERSHTGKVTLRDYDFEKPSTDLTATTGEKAEAYDYPGRYLTRAEGDRYARIRLEEREIQGLRVKGSGNCRGLVTGFKFTLADHYRDDNNQAWATLSLAHHAQDNSYRGKRGSVPFEYKNEFEAVPHSARFRPACTALKPIVQGPQTAVVVGRSGEEIFVDKYGRVKVQFFWDREGKKNESSSCWVRVCQSWAGKQWGWMTIPRIGQEVVVDFLEGDPDRPIITGRVYNAEQMPPYTLPSDMTQSGWKSRSSKGGGSSNFNELRFEDKKGSEEVYLQAEKDMTELVKNDRTITVDGKHTETIKLDTAITITQGNLTLDINQGNRTTTIKLGNDSTKISAGKSTTEAMQSIELKVGPSSIKIDPASITLKAAMIKLEGTAMVQIKAPMVQVNGDGMVIIKGGLVMIN